MFVFLPEPQVGVLGATTAHGCCEVLPPSWELGEYLGWDYEAEAQAHLPPTHQAEKVLDQRPFISWKNVDRGTKVTARLLRSQGTLMTLDFLEMSGFRPPSPCDVFLRTLGEEV